MSLNVIVYYKNYYKAMNSLNYCLDLENKDDEYTRPCMTCRILALQWMDIRLITILTA